MSVRQTKGSPLSGVISVLAKLAGVALLVAGCGNSDDSADATPTTSSTIEGATTTLPPTTTTVTSTTVTTTSSTTSTSTTDPCLLGGSSFVELAVVFSITNDETIGALQFDTEYSSDVDPSGSGSFVECVRLAGDFAAFNDVESTRTLRTAIVSVGGVTGPVDVAYCTFSATFCGGPPGFDDFVVTITDQSHPDFSPANATVEITDLGLLYPTTSTTISLP
jgi:hypothetical protein